MRRAHECRFGFLGRTRATETWNITPLGGAGLMGESDLLSDRLTASAAQAAPVPQVTTDSPGGAAACRGPVFRAGGGTFRRA